jgi:cbb3-type cytochrome oxidase maturation protein
MARSPTPIITPPDGITMEALYILVPVSIVIVFIALWVFFRASDSGQFDDLVGPGMRILQDDDNVRDQSQSDRNTRPDPDKTR